MNMYSMVQYTTLANFLIFYLFRAYLHFLVIDNNIKKQVDITGKY